MNTLISIRQLTYIVEILCFKAIPLKKESCLRRNVKNRKKAIMTRSRLHVKTSTLEIFLDAVN